MNGSYSILENSILKSNNQSLFKYWKSVLAAEIGWHYPLDIIWILDQIDSLNLPVGSTILDAGAGYGLLQFILSAKGYKVISVDLMSRTAPIPYRPLFNFKIKNDSVLTNEYTKHLQHIKSEFSLNASVDLLIHRLAIWKPYTYLIEALQKQNHGEIILLQSDISNLRAIKSGSVAAVVSVSAIEHLSSFTNIKKAINEFQRVIQKKGEIFITTSLSDKSSWFHKPSQGWCFSKKDLTKIFKVSEQRSGKMSYSTALDKINSINYLKDNLPRYYFYKSDCGMPWGVWDPKYLPVGIILVKSQLMK